MLRKQAHTARKVVDGRTSCVGLSIAGHGRKLRDCIYVWRTESLAVGDLEKVNLLSQLSSGGNEFT